LGAISCHFWSDILYELFPFRSEWKPAPVISYDEALQRVKQIRERELSTDGDCALNELCLTSYFAQSEKSAHCILLLHGFTNCPYQYQQLAPLLQQLGHSVLALRLPRHGCADQLTGALAELHIGELLRAVTEAVDIAHGLGHRVTVLGFSMGGVLAAWLAQNRAGLHQAILISPAVGLQALPAHRHRVIAHALALLPNFYQWWNPKAKSERIGPQHAYPRFASRSLAVLIRLGLAVRSQAKRQKPATSKITVITNPSDSVIRHEQVRGLIHDWTTHGASVQEYKFPAEWELIHDFMDPLQQAQQVDHVYPLLLQWVEESLHVRPQMSLTT